MYRGRLIFPFGIELAQLSLSATEIAGVDPDFKEPAILPTDDLLGESARAEEALIVVPGQFVSTSDFLRLMEAPTGNLEKTSFVILFHFADLEAAGLIEQTTGLAKIKVGDRLSAVYDRSGNLIQKIKKPPGTFVESAKPIFGLSSMRNLLEVTFASNDQGPQSGA